MAEDDYDAWTAKYVAAVGGSPTLVARVARMGNRIKELESQVVAFRRRIVAATSIEFPGTEKAPKTMNRAEACAWSSGYNAALRDTGRALLSDAES